MATARHRLFHAIVIVGAGLASSCQSQPTKTAGSEASEIKPVSVQPTRDSAPQADVADAVMHVVTDYSRLARLGRVVAMTCINESLACAFLDASIADCASMALASCHREHLADEIQHANVDAWHRRIEQLPDAVPGHLPKRGHLHAVIDDAVDRLVLPGFEHVGLVR